MAALLCGQTKNCLEESKNRYSTVSKFMLSFEAKGIKQKKLHWGTGINYSFFLLFVKASKLSILLRRFSPSNHVAYATCTSPIMQLISPSSPTPQNFAEALFSISLGTAVIPRRNEKQRLWKILFWVGGGGGKANKVHYGKCGSGE